MYKRIDSIGSSLNNSNSFIQLASNLYKNYKYLLISTLSVFLILNLLVSSNNSNNPSAFTLSQTYTKDVVSNNQNNNNTLAISKPPRKNVNDMFTIESRLNYYFPFKSNEDIENNIWQMWLTKSDDKDFPSDCKTHIERWRSVNDNYNHNFISIQEAEEMVVDYLKPNVPEIVDALRSLPNERLKFEFLKYLVVYISGGLYADIDTIDVKPLKYWFDSKLIGTKLMVGINSDYNDLNWEKLYNRRLSFSTNLFRAKSHHPFLAKLISRIAFICFTQKELIQATNWDEAFQNVDANGEPLIQFTGSSIFTDSLFEYLNNLSNAVFIRVAKNDNDRDPKPIVGPQIDEDQRFSYRSFSGIIAPTQIDDIVVMPLITFNGLENGANGGLSDEYDNNDEKVGYEKFYYGRSLGLTAWSNKRQRIESS